MPTLAVTLALGGLALLPAMPAAKPPVCTSKVVQQTLIDAGKLTADSAKYDEVVDLVRCGDVTDDGHADAVFTVSSGGTAGDTRFGVLHGASDGSPGTLVLYKQGYKTGVARHDQRSFDVLQPHYAAADPNCCPSSFREQRYTWTGTRFKAGKTIKLKTAPRRFYQQ